MSGRPLALGIVSRLPSPTALTFLSGLFAGAGINMLTSTATGESSTSAGSVAFDAVAWVAAAAFLSWVAHRLDAVQRQAAFYIMDPNLSPAVKQAELDKQLGRIAPATTVLLALTVVCLVAAVLLLPGFIDWSRLQDVFTSPPPPEGTSS